MDLANQSTLIWLGFLVASFTNGAFREFVLISQLEIPQKSANQFSCLTGMAVLTLTLLVFWRKLEIRNSKQALYVGLYWMLTTFLFETFIINRNLSWSQILNTYDIISGEYWGIVLLWIGILPSLFYGMNQSFIRKTK